MKLSHIRHVWSVGTDAEVGKTRLLESFGRKHVSNSSGNFSTRYVRYRGNYLPTFGAEFLQKKGACTCTFSVKNVTGSAPTLGQVEAVHRHLKLKHWANLKLLGQSCSFHVFLKILV